MDLHRQADLLPGCAHNQSRGKTGAGAAAFWPQDLLTDLFTSGAAQFIIAIVLSSAAVYTELCQPAQAQSRNGLGWMGTFDHPRGSRAEFAAPSGFTCRYEQGSRPSLNVGVGVSEPPILNGIGGTIVVPSAIGQPTPVGGIFLHIPLGVDKGSDCKRLVQIEMAMLKLQNAKALMMEGLITKEQLETVVQQTYATISSID